MWLETGKTYYFIDSVVGGCLDGRKLSVSYPYASVDGSYVF